MHYADAPEVHRLLRRGSQHIVHFDLRLPSTSVKKLVSGSNFTYLNSEDNSVTAVYPPVPHLRLYTSLCPDTTIDVYPSKRLAANVPAAGAGYEAGQVVVTVQDVLKALAKMLGTPIDTKKFVLDTMDPEIHDRLDRAFKRRLSMFRLRSQEDEKAAEKKGKLMVDYLGSRYIFAGFTVAFDENLNTWLVLDSVRDRK